MLNWAIGIDMYTLMCIKLMPNKNLQYKKTNKTTNKKKTCKKKMKLKTFRFILIDFRSRFAHLVVETTDSSLFAIFLS